MDAVEDGYASELPEAIEIDLPSSFTRRFIIKHVFLSLLAAVVASGMLVVISWSDVNNPSTEQIIQTFVVVAVVMLMTSFTQHSAKHHVKITEGGIHLKLPFTNTSFYRWAEIEEVTVRQGSPHNEFAVVMNREIEVPPAHTTDPRLLAEFIVENVPSTARFRGIDSESEVGRMFLAAIKARGKESQIVNDE